MSSIVYTSEFQFNKTNSINERHKRRRASIQQAYKDNTDTKPQWSLHINQNHNRSNSISTSRSVDYYLIPKSNNDVSIYDRYYSSNGRIRNVSGSDRRGSNSSCRSIDSRYSNYSLGYEDKSGGQWLRNREGRLTSMLRLSRDGNIYRDGHGSELNYQFDGYYFILIIFLFITYMYM